MARAAVGTTPGRRRIGFGTGRAPYRDPRARATGDGRISPAGRAPSDRPSPDPDLTFLRNSLSTMPTGERHLYGRNREAEQLALQREWRRLTRAATFVAVLTSPVTFAFFYVEHDWPLIWSLVATFVFVIMFRGFMDVLAHRLIPRASMY